MQKAMKNKAMGLSGFVLSLLSILAMFAAFVPFMGFINWLNIPFAVIAGILCVLGIFYSKGKKLGVAGLIFCIIAVVVGVMRITNIEYLI